MRLDFLADSDADIVRGLIGVLRTNVRRAASPRDFGIRPGIVLHRLGLDQNLSMGRRNGLASMIQRIRAYAVNLAAEPSKAMV